MRIVERDGFRFAEIFVAWKTPRKTNFRPLFRVAPETALWDGTQATLALASRDAEVYQYTYVEFRQTGRTLTWVPFWGQHAYRCQITLNPGTEEAETFSAWCLEVPRSETTVFLK